MKKINKNVSIHLNYWVDGPNESLHILLIVDNDFDANLYYLRCFLDPEFGHKPYFYQSLVFLEPKNAHTGCTKMTIDFDRNFRITLEGCQMKTKAKYLIYKS